VVVVVDVVVVVVVDVDVVFEVVVLDVVVAVVVVAELEVVDGSVVECVVVVLVVDDGGVLPPQCSAFPLLPSLPQLPLSGFPPVPFLLVSVTPASTLVLVFGAEPPVPLGSSFEPVLGDSAEWAPAGFSGGGGGSATAKAPPRPQRIRPENTRQADAALCTRVPTSPTTLLAPMKFCRSDDSPTKLLTVCCRFEAATQGHGGARSAAEVSVGLHQ